MQNERYSDCDSRRCAFGYRVRRVEPGTGENGDTNAYYVSYFKNVAYESEYYESIKRRLILEEINDHVVQLEPTECTFESAKVQVGFASVQIDEMTYGIIVFQIPTVRPAEAETTGMFS